MEISRRNFIRGTLAGVVSLATFGLGLDGEAKADAPSMLPSSLDAEEFNDSETEMETITAWDEEKTYEIVVVGAGAAGMSAALTANQYSDSVCVLQKMSAANSQGSGPNGVNYAASDLNGILAFANQFQSENAYRNDRALFMAYLKNSYNAINLVREAAEEGSPEMPEVTFKYSESTAEYGGFEVAEISLKFTPKPISNSEGVILLAKVAENRGVDFYYDTPAVQLIKEDGRVTAVLARAKDGTVTRFNADKGVILCTGDYQNNANMVKKYCPDVYNFGRKQVNKTGDGHLMAIMAGGVMEPIGHTKMLHDMDSNPVYTQPFMMVNMDGVRFMNETISHEKRNNVMRYQTQPGRGIQIFDSTFTEQLESWGGRPVSVETLEMYIRGNTPSDATGLYPELVDVHKADTLEELAEEMEIPTEQLLASVKRYNELCDKGVDEDFGKDAKYLKKIEQGPFYAAGNTYRISAITSGVLVNENNQVIDEEYQVIPGLYACGNCSGAFFGGADYPFTMKGVSLGRAYTQGHIAAKHALGQEVL